MSNSLMIPDPMRPVHCFRFPPEIGGGRKSESVIEDDIQDEETDNGETIRCRQCLKIITSPSDRTTMQGSHRHTFANPQGCVFQIGCFRAAGGCGHAGKATDEFTWFPGFKWQIALCAGCLIHLGWHYVSPGGESFHGLILDRLTAPSD